MKHLYYLASGCVQIGAFFLAASVFCLPMWLTEYTRSLAWLLLYVPPFLTLAYFLGEKDTPND